MYNPEERRRLIEQTYGQIQQARPEAPLLQQRKQLKQEIRFLQQKVRDQDENERLIQAKRELTEITTKFKGLLSTTLSNIKSLQLPESPKFVTFEQIAQLVSQNQIEQYMVDPLLQCLVAPPNKILTIVDRGGNTYLVRARYDRETNQIYPPV